MATILQTNSINFLVCKVLHFHWTLTEVCYQVFNVGSDKLRLGAEQVTHKSDLTMVCISDAYIRHSALLITNIINQVYIIIYAYIRR